MIRSGKFFMRLGKAWLVRVVFRLGTVRPGILNGH